MPHDAGVSPAQRPRTADWQLVNDATEQIARLVCDEMRLAAAKLQQKGKRLSVRHPRRVLRSCGSPLATGGGKDRQDTRWVLPSSNVPISFDLVVSPGRHGGACQGVSGPDKLSRNATAGSRWAGSETGC